MEFLIDGVKYAAVAGAIWWAVQLVARRHALATVPDSNAPQGRPVQRSRARLQEGGQSGRIDDQKRSSETCALHMPSAQRPR